MTQLNPPRTNRISTVKRPYHYLLTGISLLLLVASSAITGCDITDSDDEPELVKANSDELVNLPFFVRAEDGSKINPETTDADMPLITDLGREPVVDPDGEQVTWGEWSDVSGSISVECREEGTYAKLDLKGLIPNGVYTVWNVTFEEPGFTGEFAAPGLPANVKAFGPVGPSNGSRSMFLASASGEGSIISTTPPGPLGTVGEIGACALTEELEWHVVGLYHSDGKTYGPERGPEGTNAEQFAFIFKAIR